MALRASENDLLEGSSGSDVIIVFPAAPGGRANWPGVGWPGVVGAGSTLPSRSAAIRKRRPIPGRRRQIQLFPQTKTINQIMITINITALQVIKKTAALADQLQ